MWACECAQCRCWGARICVCMVWWQGEGGGAEGGNILMLVTGPTCVYQLTEVRPCGPMLPLQP